MTYEYKCRSCAHTFDVIKTVSEMERAESCAKCQGETDRQFVPRAVYFSGTSVQHAEFNPGLGCVVNNKYERSEICKQRGLTEIGNDYKTPDAMHKHFDDTRADKRKKEWDAL